MRPRTHRRWWRGAALALLAAGLAGGFFLVGCCAHPRVVTPDLHAQKPRPAAKLPTPVPPTAEPTRIELIDTDLRLIEGITLRIHYLYGRMRHTRKAQPIVFSDRSSYRIDILTAEAAMSDRVLERLMNGWIFAYRGAPLSDLSIRTRGDRLVQRGVLHKGVDLPFTLEASISATDDGRIRLRPESVKICRIPGKGLMRILGIHLDDLLDLSGATGVEVDGNDLLLDPNRILPPPEIRGRLTAVRVAGGEVVLQFGPPRERVAAVARWPKPPRPDAGNYQFLYGGTVRFGRIYMVATDMQIVDADPSDPFLFYIDKYQRQLVAGDEHTLPDGGLLVRMPDYDDVARK